MLEMNNDCNDVSIIVCTKNAEDTIEKVLEACIKNNPKELIVVVAHSTDETIEILKKYNEVVVVEDPGKGLALARQIGIEHARGEYVFFCGDDNIIEEGSIGRLKQYMLSHEWVGAAMLTRLKYSDKNYWTFGSNERWILRFFEGERNTIGTPYLFAANVLKKYKYDPKMRFSDDADIEQRIRNDGYRIGYSDVICYEVGKDEWKDVKSRYIMYGQSDYEIWKKYSSEWNIVRKIKSICHPLVDELIKPFAREKNLLLKIKVLPYFVIITAVRYIGWVRAALR